LVRRQQTPAPTLAGPDDSRDGKPESQADVEQTGTEFSPGISHFLKLSSVEHPDDIVHIDSSPLGFRQSAADVDIGALAMHWPFLR
jgi:hypothetical protein